MPHIPRRRPSRLRWQRRKTNSSMAELLRDFCRADRRTDLHKQTMRFPQLALAGGLVTDQSRQLGALDVKEGLVALRPRHLEPSVGFGKRGLDVSSSLDASGLAESAHADELREELI